MVIKGSGKWRMYIDYTDLNRACPKNSYSIPNIDQLVNNSANYPFLPFMDAYSGHNQVLLYGLDRMKIVFMIEQANYRYNVIPFKLNNVGAT